MSIAATTGPTPKMSVSDVPDAAMASAMRFLETRIWLSKRLPRASSPEKQAAAWEFVKFLSAPEQQATLTVRTRGGYLPIRRSAVQDPALQQMWQQDPRTRVAYDQLLQGPTNPISAGPVLGDPSGTGDAVVDALTRMLAGDLAPQNAPPPAQPAPNPRLPE